MPVQPGQTPAIQAAPECTRLLGGFAHAPALISTVLAILLRLPTLADPHYYTDEGIFAAVAQRLLQGHPLYSGSWDDKPPLIFWLYALLLDAFGPSMLALRITATMAAAAAAVAVATLATRLAGRRAGIAAGALCVIATATPLVEGNLALTELFGAAPAAWGLALVIGSTSRRRASDMTAGALLAAAFLFKQVFALDAVAAGVILLASGRPGPRRLLSFIVGFGAVCGVVAAVLAAQRALDDGLYASFGFYLLYLGDGSAVQPQRWFVAALALFLSAAMIRRGMRDAPAIGPASIWLIWTLVGVLVGGRPYGHYLIQAAAPLALWAALLPHYGRPLTWPRTAAMVAPVLALALVAWSFLPFFQRDRTVTLAYYANVARLLSGSESRRDFGTWYTWRVAAQDEFVAAMAGEAERTLFVWGEYPWLYPLSGAENPTRFPTSFAFSFVPGSREEAIAALRRKPPRFIVWEGDEWRRLPGLSDLIDTNYELIATSYESRLYRRR